MRVNDHEMRIVAALAGVDVRTLRRVLEGNTPRSRATAQAIALALRDRGFKAEARRVGVART